MNDDVTLLQLPKNQSRLIWINEQCFVLTSPQPVPNWWWRMWQFLILGIKWEKIDE